MGPSALGGAFPQVRVPFADPGSSAVDLQTGTTGSRSSTRLVAPST